jgi:GGDEF domain-containing protein
MGLVFAPMLVQKRPEDGALGGRGSAREDSTPHRIESRLVRACIAKHKFTGGQGLKLTITASFGIASFPGDAESPGQLVAFADSAMYEAKAARKNCVRQHRANPVVPVPG